MTERHNPQDEELIQKLKRLQQYGSPYPPELLRKRQRNFRKNLRNMMVVPPFIGFFKNPVNYLTHLPAKAVEGLLIGTLVATTAGSAYLLRHQIADWLTPDPTPTLTVITSTPVSSQTPTTTLTSSPTPTLLPSEATEKPHPTDQGYHYGQTKTPKP